MDADLCPGADRGERRTLREDLGVRTDAHLEVCDQTPWPISIPFRRMASGDPGRTSWRLLPMTDESTSAGHRPLPRRPAPVPR